jgi:hypothetical protein
MRHTMSTHDLLALATYATRTSPECAKYAQNNPTATDNLVRQKLVTIGPATPIITDRGRALIDFMCALPLPIAKTIWELPDDPS